MDGVISILKIISLSFAKLEIGNSASTNKECASMFLLKFARVDRVSATPSIMIVTISVSVFINLKSEIFNAFNVKRLN